MSQEPAKPQEAADPDAFPKAVKLTPEEETARKRRNFMIGLGLVAFIALIFVTTMVRMSSNYNSGA